MQDSKYTPYHGAFSRGSVRRSGSVASMVSAVKLTAMESACSKDAPRISAPESTLAKMSPVPCMGSGT